MYFLIVQAVQLETLHFLMMLCIGVTRGGYWGHNPPHCNCHGKFVSTVILKFYDQVTRELDKKSSVDIFYIDFQKAFDKVPHEALIFKLEKLGIRGKTLLWISNWLTGRKQRVQVKGNYSQWAEVMSGVPQGSVLGPILFIIFINDISQDIRNKISIFADDLKIWGRVDTQEQILNLQKDLDIISAWAEKWGMSFNIGKCQVLHMGFKNSRAEFYLKGDIIKEGNTVKDLGVIINEDFKMVHQCSAASKKANRILGYIKKTVSTRSEKIILPLYRGLVRPHLEYAVQFWSPYLKKDIESIERVQHRATKLITGISSLSYEERLEKLNMFTLERRRTRGDLIQLFKLIKQGDTEGINFNTDSRTRGHRFKLRKAKFNLDRRKHYFYNRVVDKWNALPETIVNSTGVNEFKKKIDKYWDSGN